MHTMKPAFLLSAPLLAFVAAAMLATVTSTPNDASGERASLPHHSRNRAAELTNFKTTSQDRPAQLARMERQIVHPLPLEKKTYDGKGMEAVLPANDFPVCCGDGMAAISYSIDWASENPQGMFQWFIRQSAVSGFTRQQLAKTLFSEWATQDMTAALAAIPSIPNAESRAQALVSTLEILSQKDPARARKLLDENIELLGSLKTVMLGYKPEPATADLWLSLPQSEARSKLLAKYIGDLADSSDRNVNLAKELWNQLPAEERRALVAAGLTKPYSSEVQLEGLETLARETAESAKDPWPSSRFLNEYGKPWAERDPNAAVSWAMTHLKGKARMDQSVALITHIASRNFDEAMQVWQNLPAGNIRERATKILSDAAPADRETEKAALQDSLPKANGEW